MPNYANGKIYCIRNRLAGDEIVYVGSTTQSIAERMDGHRQNAKRCLTNKLHTHMNEVGVKNFHVELIVDFPCERREQLATEEGKHIRLIRPICNTQIAGRSKQEYLHDNADVVFARRKAWRIRNAEELSAKKKAYYEQNKEAHAARSKAYRELNAVDLAAKSHAKYERRKAERTALANA